MSTTSELVERLQNVSEWKQVIERHRRITDDPRISYVLQDGTRVHEDEDVIAKLAASLSRALEDAANTASAAAARIAQLEGRFAHYHKGPGYLCAKCGLGLTDEIHVRVDDARAALEEQKP
jgi:hypothetical protein